MESVNDVTSSDKSIQRNDLIYLSKDIKGDNDYINRKVNTDVNRTSGCVQGSDVDDNKNIVNMKCGHKDIVDVGFKEQYADGNNDTKLRKIGNTSITETGHRGNSGNTNIVSRPRSINIKCDNSNIISKSQTLSDSTSGYLERCDDSKPLNFSISRILGQDM